MAEDKQSNWFEEQQKRSDELMEIARGLQNGDIRLNRQTLDELKQTLEEKVNERTSPTPADKEALFEHLRKQHGDLPRKELVIEGFKSTLRNLQSMARDMKRPTPLDLEMAVITGDLEKTRSLIEQGVPVTQGAAAERSLLLQAAIVAKPEIVAYLRERGAPEGLLEAAALGEAARVDRLLEEGADPNEADGKGVSALQWAASRGHSDVMRLLLERGADPNATCITGHTPLYSAVLCERGQEVVELLLDAGARVGAVEAALLGRTEEVLRFVKSGTSIEVRSSYGMTPLMAACAGGHVECAAALVDGKADVYAATEYGHTPLAYAVVHNRLDIIEMLLDHGVEVNHAHRSENPYVDGRTVLWAAVLQPQSTEALRLLLERGADPAHRDGKGDTALVAAARGPSSGAIRLLVDAGADVEARGTFERTPLIWASTLGNKETVRTLLEKGASVNAADKHGATALICAAGAGNAEAVEVLLNAGADPNRKNEFGSTALSEASREGHSDVVKLLRDHGATVDEFGDVFGAALFGHGEVLKELEP